MDTVTRWNSTLDMIERGLKKRDDLEVFIAKLDLERDVFKRVPLEDRLSTDDWLILAETADILKPFKDLTIWLQSRAEDAVQGSVWETLPAIELLLEHLEHQKVVYQDCPEPSHAEPIVPEDQPSSASSTRRRRRNSLRRALSQPQPPRQGREDELNDASRRHIRTAINNAWEKLDTYYALTDETPVYLAALVLHPGQKWRYFEQKWAEHDDWLQDAKEKMKAFYQEYWQDLPVATMPAARPRSAEHRELAPFQLWLTPHDYYAADEVPVDEYEAYMVSRPVPFDHPLEWWRANQSTYPRLAQMAFDLLSIPAMCAECERVFSQAKLTLVPQRNRMMESTLNALRCLKDWGRKSPIR